MSLLINLQGTYFSGSHFTGYIQHQWCIGSSTESFVCNQTPM